MARVSTTTTAEPRAVFGVLTDPYQYEHWVVGARAIRGVDANWPEAGSRFHHNVGLGPFNTSDTTKIIEIDRPWRLVLEARARPAGVAKVALTLEPEGPDTKITIDEVPIRGLAARWHNPLFDLLIKLRNVESLRRLKKLAEDRQSAPVE